MENNILMIASLDGFANSVWAAKIQQYIARKGYKVDVLDTLYLGRFASQKGKFATKLPQPHLYELLLYMLEITYYFFLPKFLPNYRKHCGYFFISSIMKVRSKIISKIIRSKHYNLIICVSQLDAYVLTRVDKNCRTIFSCPTPFAEELYYGNLLTDSQHKKLMDFETKIYERCTYLSFHWDTYAQYIKKYYHYALDNIVNMNKGTEETASKAEYTMNPKIVYLGKLDGYWINLPLLSKLSKIYPIDVYGSPAPDPKYELNYKGYATSDILSQYQFGLITITDDKLRREGFSAKHLDYLSYGLPVLIPEWRANAKNLKGTVLFNEDNFLSCIRYYAQKEQWDILHTEALQQAKELRWENTLKALDNILEPQLALVESH
jgi:hypothetical protein